MLFNFFPKITARMNVIPLETTQGEYEVQVLGERIESGGYEPFKYTIIILNEQRTRRDGIRRDPLSMDTLSTSYDPRDNNRRIQTSRDALQSVRLSTNYDPRDNNRRTQTSRDALQSVRFSTSYDLRDNNRSIEDH
jgi:hypothetical protein